MFEERGKWRILLVNIYEIFIKTLLILKYKDGCNWSCWESLQVILIASWDQHSWEIHVLAFGRCKIVGYEKMRRKSVCKQRTTLSVQCFPDTFIDFFVQEQIQPIFCISGSTKGILFHTIPFMSLQIWG